MDQGYGKSILGYFGHPPLDVDPEVQKIASEQLKLEVFDGNPLDAAEETLAPAQKALEDRKLPVTEENIFLVASAMVSGKDIELNEGIRLLEGRCRITLPLKKADPKESAPKPANPASGGTKLPDSPVTTECVVEENGKQRRFKVTLEFGQEGKVSSSSNTSTPAKPQEGSKSHEIFSPFDGEVELVELRVRVGDSVQAGQVVAAVEAMKAKHDIKSPVEGVVQTVSSTVGSIVTADHSIITLATK